MCQTNEEHMAHPSRGLGINLNCLEIFNVQPKPRLYGAFSAVSLHQIADTSAGVQTRQLGIHSS